MSRGLEFSPSTRFVDGERDSIILDLASRKWVRLPTEGLALLRRVLEGRAEEEGGGLEGLAAPRVENTIRRLYAQGFLVAPGEMPPAPEARSSGPSVPVAVRTLHLHVTQRCNLACTTCYVADYLRKGPDRLSTDDVRAILSVAAESGFARAVITGGEPLLREDILTVLAAARSLFRRVNLVTNGLALTEALGRELASLTDTVNVSLDGGTAAVNDRIRGKGSFDQVLRGLRALRDGGYPMRRVSINPTVTRLNHHDLDGLMDLAAGFGATVSFGFFMPTGRGLCNQDRLSVGCREMSRLFDRVVARSERAAGVTAEGDAKMAMARVRTDCSIGTIFTIQAEGSIFPCPNLNQPEHCLGNYFDLSAAAFAERLRSPAIKARYLARVVDAVPGCADCGSRYFCGGGCMANAYMTHGDLYARDPYCAFYQAVWRAYGPLRSHVAAGERMPASDRVADADR